MELNISEPVAVDGDRIVELCVGLGEDRAEEMIAISVDNLWRGLEHLKEAYRGGHFEEMADISQGLSQIADNLGLRLFARVARDVEACGRRGDVPALSGCLSRLVRISDASINSVWESCDITG